MKNTIIVVLVLLLGGLSWYTFLWEKPFVVPEGMVLVSDTFIDSLKAVADRPPDTTVVTETVIQEKIVTVVKEKPVPVSVDPVTGQHTYIDSVKMIDDGINAWVRITSQDIINEITWGYKPVFKTITKEISIPAPYPVEVLKYRPQRGLFLSGGIGAGPNTAGFSLGLSWQQCNGLTYGVEVLQFDTRYYMAKMGFMIF